MKQPMTKLRRAALATLAAATMLAAPLAAPAIAAEPNQMFLFSGRSKLISTPSGFERVAVADPAIADVQVVSNRQVMVRALKPGTTSLIVWTKGSGAVPYEIEVGVDARGIERQIRTTSGNDNFRVAFNGHAIVISGAAATLHEREAAEKVAASYGYAVVNLIQPPNRREQIQIDVMVLELNKSAGLNLGAVVGGGEIQDITNGVRKIVFKPGEVMTGMTAGIDPKSFAPFDLLTARVEALARRGEAKLLARPSLVTADGGTAKFLAGGEVPIPVAQGLGQTSIQWKEFGVRLEAQPTITNDGRVALTVKPEVSSLDFANGLKQQSFNVPAIRSRRAETQVVLAPRETLMLGGLMNNEHSRGWEQIPGLGDIPILGELFKSRRFQDQQSELAILVTPRLISPDHSDKPSGRLPAVKKELEQEMVP